MNDERYDRIRDRFGERIELNPAFVCVAVTPNELHFRAGPASGPVFSVEDDDEDGVLEDFVPVLTGNERLADFAREFDDPVVDDLLTIVTELGDRNIVLPADDETHSAEEDAARGYVSLQNEFIAGRYSDVDDRGVLVVTDGRIGEMILDDLLAMNVGSLSVIDYSSTEGSTTHDRVTVRQRERFERAVAEADFVVCASESPRKSLAERTNEAAYDAKTPWLNVQLIGFDGILGPLVVPGDTACYECFAERFYSNVPQTERYRTMTSAGNGSPRSLPSFARTLAGLGATDVLNYLSDGIGFTAGRIVHHDFFDLSVEPNDVLRLPRCTVCGADPITDEQQRHVTMEQLVDRVMKDD